VRVAAQSDGDLAYGVGARGEHSERAYPDAWYRDPALAGTAVGRDRARERPGQVMG
jgi:hypothetical protein